MFSKFGVAVFTLLFFTLAGSLTACREETSSATKGSNIIAGQCKGEDFCNGVAAGLVRSIHSLKQQLQIERSQLLQTCNDMKKGNMKIKVPECNNVNF